MHEHLHLSASFSVATPPSVSPLAVNFWEKNGCEDRLILCCCALPCLSVVAQGLRLYTGFMREGGFNVLPIVFEPFFFR